MQPWTVIGCCLQHADKSRGLFRFDLCRPGVKKTLCSDADAEYIFTKRDGIEIQRQDLILGIDIFDPVCQDHFPCFIDECRCEEVFFTWVQVFCQLLRDGTPAPGGAVHHQDGLEQDPTKAPEIDAMMVIKPGVFCSDKGIDQEWREFIEFRFTAVFNEVLAEQCTVTAINF